MPGANHRQTMHLAPGLHTFRDYMAWNNVRYYGAGTARVGRNGDFYTSVTVHPSFGWALARQCVECWERLGRPAPFTILEFGGGDGRLAAAILDGLSPECHRATAYLISDYAPPSNSRWRSLPPFSPAFPRSPFTGVVLAHEFVDALPVHRVIRCGNEWREIRVRVEEERVLGEEEGNLSTPELAGFFDRLGLVPPSRCHAEVPLDAIAWLRWVAANLERGFVITIDYGDLAEHLLVPERPRGTIRAISRHRLAEDLYGNPGEHDLTAHVNFSALIAYGRQAGLDPTGLTLQSHFLLGIGIQDLAKPDELVTVKRLILPGGLGDYKVLIQHKGCAPGRLAGLTGRTIPAEAVRNDTPE